LELEIIEYNEQKNAVIINAKVQVGLEGQKQSSEEHWKQLEIYITIQQSQM
jgi:hypothetical protein